MVYNPKRKYEWWDGYGRVVDANTVGGVVEQLEEKNGKVTKEDFLEASRPEDSVTHALFEWDDSKAAEAYRLDQSRNIINSLRVVYVKPDKEEVKLSAFVQTHKENGNAAYENIHDALKDEGKREVILNRIRGELEAFVIRNQHIEELADILEEKAIQIRRKKNGNNV